MEEQAQQDDEVAAIPPDTQTDSHIESETPLTLANQDLELELAKTKKRVDELARALMASEKDRDDFKLRTNRERERLVDVEKGKVAVSLVEAVDELELCLKGQAASALVQGVRLIRDTLLKKLTALGCDRVQLVGLPFDPNYAEASDMEICIEEDQDQMVTGELRACFRLNGKVIRPGLVRVAKFVAPVRA